jgi:monofunctional biosynthetic peptidoglycan transglycosylase
LVAKGEVPNIGVTARRAKRRWWIRILWLGLPALGLWLAYEAWTWPDIGALARRSPTTTAFIEEYKRQERAAKREPRVQRIWVPYGAISPHLKRAVLVAEDINFFSHQGFELTEIRNVLEQAIEEGELRRGASTITQQLVKNLWLSPSRNPLRKVKEAILTWQIERRLDKRRILEVYLNVVELGRGIYGAEAASRHYFGKAAAELTPDEAAQLAASLPNPSAWHPGSGSRAYQRHIERIQRRMAKAEFLWKQI